MVAHLVRLKLTLLRNGLRRSAWQVVGLVVAALYGLVAMVLAVAGLVGLSVEQPGWLPAITVLLGSALALAWWLVPVVAFGVDATVDPLRFVIFPIPRRTLVVGLTLGALVGVPGAVTTVVAAATAAVWWREPVAVVVGLVGAVLGLLTCVVGSRASTTLVSAVLARRRFREVLGGLAILPFVLLGPVLSRVGRLGVDEGTARSVARVLGWTPVGAPWALAGAAAEGDALGVVARLAVAVLTVLVLAVVWDRSLARMSVNPPGSGSAGRARARGLGWFDRLPATPLGAVTARCLTYWVRDPRYAMSVVFVPVVPLILWFAVGPDALAFVGPLTAFFLGWSISSDVSFDGTAFWTHVAAPLRGQVDRLGRLCASLVLSVPVVLLLAVLPAALSGRGHDLPALVGASLGVLLTAYGAASVASALVVMPVQKVGESPFQSKQGASTAAVTSQLAGWAAAFVLSLPTAVLAVLAVRQGSVPLGWLTLAVGLVVGLVVLVLGVRVGGRVLDRNQTHLLSKLVSFP